MKRALFLGTVVLFAGAASAATPRLAATHAPTVIGDGSRSVSPVGYVYTDPPAPFSLPSGLARSKAHHRVAAIKPPKPATIAHR